MLAATKNRPFDLILPGVLVGLFPLNLIAGLIKGVYPNQATPLSTISLLLGLYLLNTLRQLSTHSNPDLRQKEWEENFEELQMIAANARLNRMLGAGLIFFGAFLNIFWIVSILAAKNRFAPEAVQTDAGRLVEAGIIILFTLMMAAAEFAGTKIYQIGRRPSSQ